jgi:hypothetical protein
VETRTHRRAVLSSGVRLAYAAPLVAATLGLHSADTEAYYGDCSCYDPADRFAFTSVAGSCDPGYSQPCGACVTCSPRYGALCPEWAVAIGGQIPYCNAYFDGFADCHPVQRPICEALISPPAS